MPAKAIQVKVPPPKALAAAPEACSAAAEPDAEASDDDMDVDWGEWGLVAPPNDPPPLMLALTDDYESIPATRTQLVQLPSEEPAIHSHTSTYMVSTYSTE